MGIILMNIAHEHLIYDNDFDKAVSTYTESFGGECPEDLVMQLLTGDMIILVDEKDQMFQVVPRGEFPHLDHLYPKLNVVEYAEKIQTEINDRCADLKTGLNNLVRKFDGKHFMSFDFSAEAVMLAIYGNDEEMIAEIRDDYELQQWQLLIKLSYEFIQTSMKKAEVIRRLSGHLETPIEIDTYRLNEIATALQKIARLDFEPMDTDVETYMKATQEIDRTLSEGIEPVDILDNWSAGWLSPEGEYYALNGEIANMLHIQIADALQKKGIIPETDEHGMEQNPDSWLEQQGWVRIHEDNVQFAGNLNQKLGKPNVRLTEKQITAIRDYITNCYACQIKAGWRREKASIGMFTAMAMRDPIALNKKYFDYD
jgi:hypothetical protein